MIGCKKKRVLNLGSGRKGFSSLSINKTKKVIFKMSEIKKAIKQENKAISLEDARKNAKVTHVAPSGKSLFMDALKVLNRPENKGKSFKPAQLVDLMETASTASDIRHAFQDMGLKKGGELIIESPEDSKIWVHLVKSGGQNSYGVTEAGQATIK